MLSRLLSTLSLAIAVSALTTTITPPGQKGAWYTVPPVVNLNDSVTDTQSIVSTALNINQKSTATGLPDQAVNSTTVTAVDGAILTSPIPSTSSRRELSPPTRRSAANYELVFNGTGVAPNDRDASIEGTAYLTFTTVNNATYNVADCLAFCDSVPTCVFANLFYEFNNPGLDASSSNLKCAIYSDTHTAVEKTNFGGQQLAPPPAGLTFIQQSSGYSSATLVDPTTPEGYELVFGPTNGANNAPGYMGFAFLDRYDVDACAQQCNTRGADSQGGACQYFNIWRAVVDGTPTTYTCSMYFIPADASTAVNTGQGNLQVTFSRGYKRTNLVIDGGFEDFNECDEFCFDTQDANWIGTSPPGGTDDATIFFFQAFAHTGNAVALLGSANANDALAGTLTPAKPLATLPGRQYSIGFFQASSFAPPAQEQPAFIDVQWNGVTIQTIRPGFSNYEFFQVTVTAKGNDVLSFHGGAAPAWSFIDDVTVFEL